MLFINFLLIELIYPGSSKNNKKANKGEQTAANRHLLFGRALLKKQTLKVCFRLFLIILFLITPKLFSQESETASLEGDQALIFDVDNIVQSPAQTDQEEFLQQHYPLSATACCALLNILTYNQKDVDFSYNVSALSKIITISINENGISNYQPIMGEENTIAAYLICLDPKPLREGLPQILLSNENLYFKIGEENLENTPFASEDPSGFIEEKNEINGVPITYYSFIGVTSCRREKWISFSKSLLEPQGFLQNSREDSSNSQKKLLPVSNTQDEISINQNNTTSAPSSPETPSRLKDFWNQYHKPIITACIFVFFVALAIIAPQTVIPGEISLLARLPFYARDAFFPTSTTVWLINQTNEMP